MNASLEITPGPWKGHSECGATVVMSADEVPIAVLYGSEINMHATGDVALIVAAPLLFDALREARAFVTILNPDDESLVEESEALLAQIDAALSAAGLVAE